MTLLVIILVFIAQRFVGLGETFNRITWVEEYLKAMQSAFKRTAIWNHWFGIILIVLPILIVCGIMQWLLHGWILGIVRFFFDFFVLWFCLDAYQLRQKLAGYFSSLQQADLAGTELQSEKFIRQNQRPLQSGLTGLARAITCEIFLRADEKLFGILFWFILLGPVGALGFFLVITIRDLAAAPNSNFVELLLPANKIFGVLNWLPVRALGMSYALTGQFVSAFNYTLKNFTMGVEQTTLFAIEAGFAGLNMEHHDVIHADAEENQNALALVDRTFYLWIVLVAIFTLGGWL